MKITMQVQDYLCSQIYFKNVSQNETPFHSKARNFTNCNSWSFSANKRFFELTNIHCVQLENQNPMENCFLSTRHPSIPNGYRLVYRNLMKKCFLSTIHSSIHPFQQYSALVAVGFTLSDPWRSHKRKYEGSYLIKLHT